MKLGNETAKKIHKKIISSIHNEWINNGEYHRGRREFIYGIRSSQISALVMYLIKIGAIKEETEE